MPLISPWWFYKQNAIINKLGNKILKWHKIIWEQKQFRVNYLYVQQIPMNSGVFRVCASYFRLFDKDTLWIWFKWKIWVIKRRVYLLENNSKQLVNKILIKIDCLDCLKHIDTHTFISFFILIVQKTTANIKRKYCKVVDVQKWKYFVIVHVTHYFCSQLSSPISQNVQIWWCQIFSVWFINNFHITTINIYWLWLLINNKILGLFLLLHTAIWGLTFNTI